MDRQFQNFNQNSFVDNQNSLSRNMSLFGNKQESIRYMDRPSSISLSQNEYNMNQSSNNRNQPKDNTNQSTNSMNQGSNNRRPVYNPNPFGSEASSSIGSPFSNDVSSIQSNNIQQSPNSNKKEIGVLFFSNNCSHSKAFLAALYKTKFNDLVKKICVDKGDVKIPKFITEVPTLICRGIQRPLVGEQVMAWLENESKKGSSQISNSEIMSYNFNTRDNYSVIGEVNDDVSVCNTFADWDKDYYINAPIESDKGDKKKSSSSSSQISEINQVSKLRSDRDSMFVDPKQKMKTAQIDPDSFNAMFIKQQQKAFKNNIKNI